MDAAAEPWEPGVPRVQVNLYADGDIDCVIGGVAFPNDGAVTVASQLWPPIRTQAASVTAFDQTHTSILHSTQLPRWINSSLRGVPDPH